jgi:hypothetical protein
MLIGLPSSQNAIAPKECSPSFSDFPATNHVTTATQCFAMMSDVSARFLHHPQKQQLEEMS